MAIIKNRQLTLRMVCFKKMYLILNWNFSLPFSFQCVQQRGAAVIKARKLSSAMSAAKAICDHVYDWWHGVPSVSHLIPYFF